MPLSAYTEEEEEEKEKEGEETRSAPLHMNFGMVGN